MSDSPRKPPHAPPPLSASRPASPEALAAVMQARTERDAAVRGVSSIAAMVDAIRAAARALPVLAAVPRVARLDAAGFRARAACGLPFIITGVAGRWPLAQLSLDALRSDHGHLPVRARTGDYIKTAFAPDRAMQDMTLQAYLDLVADTVGRLAALSRQPGTARAEPPVPLAGLVRQDGSAALLDRSRPAPSRRCIATTTTTCSRNCGAPSASSSRRRTTTPFYIHRSQTPSCPAPHSTQKPRITRAIRWRARRPWSNASSPRARCCTSRPAGTTRCAH